MAIKRFLVFGLLVSFLGLFQAEALGQAETFTIKLTGQKTWGIQVGFGDPALLSLEGLSPGQLTLTQSLWAQIEGTVMDFLTIKASFNDQLGPEFQEFLVIVDKKPWYAELGRFVVGAEGDALGVYNKKVLGARVNVAREGLGLNVLLARLEGISESLTFRGTTNHVGLAFYFEDPNQPWLPAPYLSSVEGLFFFELRAPFVEGFSKATLAFRLGPAFSQFLSDWGLGYLQEIAAKNATVELSADSYLVFQDNGYVLLFRRDPKDLLRKRIVDLIDLYNSAQGGSEKKEYPFVEGSDLEAAFLSALVNFAEIRVDEEAYPLTQAKRHRYLYLGETGIIEDSLRVEIRLPGDAEFRDLTDPLLSAYSVRLFSEKGVLRLDFPEEFFRSGAAIRVSFDYTQEGATFFLGLSLIPGSEKVYLNGQLLKRNVDYSIDYEAGILTLFVTMGPQDELRVDFERQRGALGVPTEYERFFLGASLELDQGALGVWQAADFGSPSPTSRTMPNTHSLAVFTWGGKLGEWDYSLRLGFSQNVFPQDDNARLPGKNRINSIVSVRTAEGEALIFAHQNGITVYQGGRFSHYGSKEGLSGRAALALLPLSNRLLIGTDSGLTIVDLSESGAFGRVRSWTRLYPEDWNKDRQPPEKFEGKSVLALARDDTNVYMATDKELIVAPIASLTKPVDWRRITLPEGAPAVLLWAGDLYLGTSGGLFRLRQNDWERLEVPGPVYALLWREGELLVAGEEGIRVLREGIGAGWVAYGISVRSMAVWQDLVWYATPAGIYREGELILHGNFTAIGSGLGALWAGTEADENYNLEVWRVAPEPQKFAQTQTGIDGRDFGQFFDPPAEEHTRLGPSVNLTLRRTLDNWDLGLSFYSRFPGYEEIGSSSRSDSHGLGFTARFHDGEKFSLNLQGWADIADLLTNPSFRLRAGVDGVWQGPVTVAFSLAPTVRELSSKAQLSVDFRTTVKAGSNPAWNLGLSGRLTAPEFYLAGNVGGGIKYELWPGFSLGLSWSRPYRTKGAAGTETLTLTGKLSGGTGYAWSISWEESLSHSLDRAEWSSSRTVTGELRLSPWSVAGGKIAPRLSATAAANPAEWRISGNLALDLGVQGHNVSLRLNAGQGFRPATGRTDRTFSLNFSWSPEALPGANLQYSRTIKMLLHPRYQPQISDDQSLRATLSFDVPRGKNELVLSWTPNEVLQLTHRFRYDAGFGPLTVESEVTFKEEKLSAKTEVEAALTLAPQWGLNISGGVLWGALPVRAAAYLNATLIANF